MSIRGSELYVQGKTKARLRLVLKLFPEPEPKTIDEMGDTFINTLIARDYPAVIELERELAKTEQAMIERLRK